LAKHTALHRSVSAPNHPKTSVMFGYVFALANAIAAIPTPNVARYCASGSHSILLVLTIVTPS